MAKRGRPPVNPNYDPVKARNGLVQAVAELYIHPICAEDTDELGHTSMKVLRETFGLSMTKIRKLLVTAGVYTFQKKLADGRTVDMVKEVQRLWISRKSIDEIGDILGVSRGTVTSFMPYQSGMHDADFTADGYDFANVSVDARRKRNQRKRKHMKEAGVMEQKEKDIDAENEKRKVFDFSQASKSGFEDSDVDLEFSSGPAVMIQIRQKLKKKSEDQKNADYVTEEGLITNPADVFEPLPEQRFALLDAYGVECPEVLEKDAFVFGAVDETGMKHFFTVRFLKMCGTEKRAYFSLEVHQVVKSEAIEKSDHQGKERWNFSEDDIFIPELSNEEGNWTCIDENLTSNYSFELIGYISNEDENIHRLMQKTADGLLNPMREIKYPHNAKAVGTINVLDDENGTVYFKVDGQRLEAQDAVDLFSPYVGFDLIYQIRDRSTRDIVESNMTLVPMHLNKFTLAQDLNNLLFAMTVNHEGKFISTTEVPAFDVLFKEIVRKFAFYAGDNPHVIGKEAGQELIKILRSVGTDDKIFPEYEIKMVQDVMQEI